MPERRTTPRKKFDYYMRVDDDDTQKLLGHMVQVSAIGLQLETTVPLLLQKDHYLRLELTAELADRPFIIFLARTKWISIPIYIMSALRSGRSHRRIVKLFWGSLRGMVHNADKTRCVSISFFVCCC